MRPVLEWTMDRHQMWRASAGELRLVAWCSAPLHGRWEIVDRNARGIIACSKVESADHESAQLAAESACLDLLLASLGAFPVEDLDEGWRVVGDFAGPPTRSAKAFADFRPVQAILLGRALIAAALKAKSGGG